MRHQADLETLSHGLPAVRDGNAVGYVSEHWLLCEYRRVNMLCLSASFLASCCDTDEGSMKTNKQAKYACLMAFKQPASQLVRHSLHQVWHILR